MNYKQAKNFRIKLEILGFLLSTFLPSVFFLLSIHIVKGRYIREPLLNPNSRLIPYALYTVVILALYFLKVKGNVTAGGLTKKKNIDIFYRKMRNVFFVMLIPPFLGLLMSIVYLDSLHMIITGMGLLFVYYYYKGRYYRTIIIFEKKLKREEEIVKTEYD